MNREEVKEKKRKRKVLESVNLFPVKENRKTAIYLEHDKKEKITNIKKDYVKKKKKSRFSVFFDWEKIE